MTLSTVALFCLLVWLLLTNLLLHSFAGSATDITVNKIDKLTSEIKQPDDAVFNDKSINPTVRTVIGGKE